MEGFCRYTFDIEILGEDGFIMNVSMQGINTQQSNSLNVLQNRHNRQGMTALHVGQRRGTNISSTPIAIKTQLLNLRYAADGTTNQKGKTRSLGGLTPIREIAKSEETRRAENLTNLRDKLRYIESRIPQFHQREIVPSGSLDNGTIPSFSANDLAVESGFMSIGKHNMSLTVGNQSFDISFSVSATDTVLDVQQRIADEINALLHDDVYASITHNSETGESSLFVNFRKSAVRDAFGNDSYGTSRSNQFMNLSITSTETGQQATELLMEIGRDHGFDQLHGFNNLLNDFLNTFNLRLDDVFLFERGELVGVNWDIFEPHELLGGEWFENQSELSWQETMSAFLENFNAMEKIDKLIAEEGLDEKGLFFEIEV